MQPWEPQHPLLSGNPLETLIENTDDTALIWLDSEEQMLYSFVLRMKVPIISSNYMERAVYMIS